MRLCVQCKPRWRGFKKKKEDARRVGAPCRKDLCCARTSTKQTARNTTLFWCAPVCWMRGVVWCGVRCRVIDHFNDYLLEEPPSLKKNTSAYICIIRGIHAKKIRTATLHAGLAGLGPTGAFYTADPSKVSTPTIVASNLPCTNSVSVNLVGTLQDRSPSRGTCVDCINLGTMRGAINICIKYR